MSFQRILQHPKLQQLLQFLPNLQSGPLIGLDIGSSNVKLVHLAEKDGEFTLEHYALAELDPDAIVDGAVMDASQVADTIRSLFTETKVPTKKVAISVAGNSVIVKKINLPIMDEDELGAAIAVEAEQYIPFEISDVHLDFHIMDNDSRPAPEGQMPVLLVAAKKDRVSEMIAMVEEAGASVVVVDVDAFGLENIFCANYGAGDPIVGLVNIGATVININVLVDGVSAFTRDISMGGSRYTEEIQKSLNISFMEAERAKCGEAIEGIDEDRVLAIVQDTNGEVAAEIGRTFDYFRSTVQSQQVSRVYLSGGGAKASGLVEQVADRLGIPVELFNPFANLHIAKGIDPEVLKQDAPFLGVAAGLATRRLAD
ncbi:MAG: pilus assembly protein PilM [Nitrospirota bacterium]|nr:pilus assembly protein PilM [Nitrospirota bacterium]